MYFWSGSKNHFAILPVRIDFQVVNSKRRLKKKKTVNIMGKLALRLVFISIVFYVRKYITEKKSINFSISSKQWNRRPNNSLFAGRRFFFLEYPIFLSITNLFRIPNLGHSSKHRGVRSKIQIRWIHRRWDATSSGRARIRQNPRGKLNFKSNHLTWCANFIAHICPEAGQENLLWNALAQFRRNNWSVLIDRDDVHGAVYSWYNWTIDSETIGYVDGIEKAFHANVIGTD